MTRLTERVTGIGRHIRNSASFAFMQGFWEHLDYCGGRTHPISADWNEAYDRGMNLAERWNEAARIRPALATFIVRVAGPFLLGAAGALALLAMLPEVGA